MEHEKTYLEKDENRNCLRMRSDKRHDMWNMEGSLGILQDKEPSESLLPLEYRWGHA